MGPRPISRGERKRELISSYEKGGFNGAAADQPRRDSLAEKARAAKTASMGPRPISRGEIPLSSPLLFLDHASMGPRPISRGERAEGPLEATYVSASMGPRPISRGERQSRRS